MQDDMERRRSREAPSFVDRDLSLDERVARQLHEDDHRQARLQAADYGRPPGTEKTSEARDLELWMKQDPTFTPEVEARVWQEGLGRGADPWNIRTDIATRKFPFRQQLIKAGRPGVKEQIDFANRMAERAEREQATRKIEAPGDVRLSLDGDVRLSPEGAVVPPPAEPPY